MVAFPVYPGRMSESPKAGKKLSFAFKLEDWAEGMDYCAIPVPASVTVPDTKTRRVDA